MGTEGTFGYIIGKKKRFMYVAQDADLLWQILVREIYVLMKHYGTKEALEEAFSKIKTTKNTATKADIEKNKIFASLEAETDLTEWYNLLRYCQSSYINILEAGHILNQKEDIGLVFILDFNKGIAQYYSKYYNTNNTNNTNKTNNTNNTNNKNKIEKIIQTATIEEIMSYEDMPTKTYTEIVREMKERFDIYYEKYEKTEVEIKKLSSLINSAKAQGAANIEEKAQQLLDTVKWEQKKLNMERRYFYHRLKSLDLIEEE
jgi:hypothetical protein